jgi:hypothetical protein
MICHHACEAIHSGVILKWADYYKDEGFAIDKNDKKYSWFCWDCAVRSRDTKKIENITGPILKNIEIDTKPCKKPKNHIKSKELMCHKEDELTLAKNLDYALEQISLLFDDDLVSAPGCPPNLDCSNNVFKTYILSKKSLYEWRKFKRYSRKKRYAGLALKYFQEIKGWSVMTTKFIKKGTFICEYTGDVIL